MTTSQAEKLIRRRIWIQAVSILGIGAAPAWLVAWLFMVRRGTPVMSAITLGTLILLSSWIGLLLIVLFTSRIAHGIRMRRAQSFAPSIRRMLSEHAGGSDLTERIRTAYLTRPRITEEVLTQILAQIAGDSRARVLQLAGKLGMVDAMERRYRSFSALVRRYAIGCLALFDDSRAKKVLLRALKDGDGRIRTDASRALARLGSRTEVESVFRFMVAQPLLIHALLAEELRPHALALGESCIPGELASGEPHRILNALDVLNAWQVVIALPDFPAVLQFKDAAVRAAAFRVLHYVSGLADVTDSVISGLNDRDAVVRTAAAIAAGRLRIEQAVFRLAEMIRREAGNAALASAYALSELGDSGMAVLEGLVATGEPQVAGIALEALEHARIGRHIYARN